VLCAAMREGLLRREVLAGHVQRTASDAGNSVALLPGSRCLWGRCISRRYAPKEAMTTRAGFLTEKSVYYLLALGCAVLILFRLFGVLFFAASSSLWLAVPAGVLLLLLLAAGDKPGPVWMVVVACVLYVLSYWYGGWDRLRLRLSSGAEPIPDLPELVLIVLLFRRWIEQRRIAK
jgi:hypothetical protein